MSTNTETKDTYNGWTNYETWVTKLWLDNDQGTQEYWLSVASELSSPNSPEYIAEKAIQVQRLSERLADEHEEASPALDGLWADLLRAVLTTVNWDEIAASLIDDAEEINNA